MGTQSPSPKGGGAPSPIFGPFLFRPNGCMDEDAIWYGGMPRFTRHCVRWGPSSPSLKGHNPQFSANVLCGQTARMTKNPLGMEVGLGPGDFVFELRCGPSYIPPEKRHTTSPNFCPCTLWPNGWMDQYATWYGGKPRPRRRCVRWGRISP